MRSLKAGLEENRFNLDTMLAKVLPWKRETPSSLVVFFGFLQKKGDFANSLIDEADPGGSP